MTPRTAVLFVLAFAAYLALGLAAYDVVSSVVEASCHVSTRPETAHERTC